MSVPPRAGLWRRLGASLVDVAGIVVVGFLLARPLQTIEAALGLARVVSIDTNGDAIMIILLALFGAAWTYPLIEILSGGSPGKWVLGLAVRRPDGRPAGIGRRLLRAVLKNAALLIALPFGMIDNITGSIICLALGLAGLIGFFRVFTADRRTLPDLIAGTAVVPRSRPV